MCVLCGATSSVVTGYAVILSHSVYYDDGDGDEGGGEGEGGGKKCETGDLYV